MCYDGDAMVSLATVLLARSRGGDGGPAFLFLVLLSGFVVAVYLVRRGRRRALRDKLSAAKDLAAESRTSEALALLRDAVRKRLSRKGLTEEEVDARSMIAVLEDRLAREVREERQALDHALAAPDAPPPPPPPAPRPSRPPSGPVAAGRKVGEFVLEGLIGEGGFGQVWRARHAVFDSPAAVKIPTHDGYLGNLRQLGKIQFTLHDERIVRVLGADLDADPPYVAMEYVEGRDLRRVLREERRLEPRRALRIFREILLAVKAAHDAGFVHRDLKPENILIGADDAVKVTDFELGRARVEAEQPSLASKDLATAASTGAIGTLAYIAPEQLSGGAVDQRADIYALGIILFELLTGERPQPGDKPSALVPGLPETVDRLFEGCYARLERRRRSVDEVLSDLKVVAAA